MFSLVGQLQNYLDLCLPKQEENVQGGPSDTLDDFEIVCGDLDSSLVNFKSNPEFLEFVLPVSQSRQAIDKSLKDFTWIDLSKEARGEFLTEMADLEEKVRHLVVFALYVSSGEYKKVATILSEGSEDSKEVNDTIFINPFVDLRKNIDEKGLRKTLKEYSIEKLDIGDGKTLLDYVKAVETASAWKAFIATTQETSS